MAFLRTTRDEIVSQQQRLLRKQLAYCLDHVPFYSTRKDQYGAGSREGEPVELSRLPTLNKAAARDNQTELRGRDYLDDAVHHSFSSGSTGEPFASYFDTKSWYRKKFYLKLRARFYCGMRLWDRVAILECDDKEKVAKRNRFAWLSDWFLKVRVFSIFEDSELLIQQLQQFKPDNIYGYPSHLFELANSKHAAPNFLPSAKRLFTSSEFLESGTRDFIEERFGAEIFDHYGSTEFKEIAWECKEHGWYHVNYDEVLCEVIGDNGPCYDEPGDVFVTDLRNRAMPLLRFELGDLAVMTDKPCACGFNGDSMKPLGGRSSDYLLMPDGVELTPFRFTTEIEYLDGIVQYQISQVSVNRIEVKSVWASPPAPATIAKVRNILINALNVGANYGEQFTIDVSVCSLIENEKNGKFKVVKRLV